MDKKVAVIIPAYRCAQQIGRVLDAMPNIVDLIYVIDDCCPDKTGEHVKQNFKDPRIRVHCNLMNLGVGGAVMAGYQLAFSDGAEVMVKIDGDGQMDPKLIESFIAPILNNEADYTKGNRFSRVEDLIAMPKIRLFGNLCLSFIAKASTGYWSLLDPTNGYTALRAAILPSLPLDKISQRYFFESDILFRLNLADARVRDIPMQSKYEDEVSNLKISRILNEFAFKHFRNLIKRIVYRYFVLDFNFASVQLITGIPILLFGLIYGGIAWYNALETLRPTPVGTIVFSSMTIILGTQLILGFLNLDVQRGSSKSD